jgi:excisionase family DNA binding protein
MKKVTYDTLPEAVTELLERVGQIEKLLTKKEALLKTKKIKKSKSIQPQKSNEESEDLLSVQEASKLLNISANNLYAYVKFKKIPFKKENGRLGFSKQDLEKWNKTRSEKKQPKSADAITVKEAVKLLNVPAPNLYYFIKSRKIPVIAKKGNKLYYSKQIIIDSIGKGGRKKKTQTKEA